MSKHKDVMFADDFSHGRIPGNYFPHHCSFSPVCFPDSELAGFDLCLLSFCTHTVHTYGTYGQWGSLLAGGEVVAAMGTNNKANSEVSCKLTVTVVMY